MNIFYVDPDPIECAMAHCNRHVTKMVTEYAQLLSMAMWVNDPEHAAELHALGRIFNAPKKPLQAHYNHPSSLWVQSSRANFDWLKTMACCLAAEYFYRYGREHNPPRQHASFLRVLIHLYSNENFPTKKFTPPPQAMPEEFRGPDTVEAYRRCYGIFKLNLMHYKRRRSPKWLLPYLIQDGAEHLPTYTPPQISSENLLCE